MKAKFKDQALRSLEKLPPSSLVLNHLLASLAREDVNLAKLADLIEKDTVLSGNVLKLVNSALFGRRGTVNSVRHAVSILGVSKLRNAALGMSITRAWSSVKTPLNWSSPRFNQHSIATAILCDRLSQEVDVVYPEGAFVAGLLHDIGLLLIAVGLPEQHALIEAAQRQNGGSLYEWEQEVLGFTHAELSGCALAVWGLPTPIQVAVQHHGAFELDPSIASRPQMLLSRLIWLSDGYIDSIGTSVEMPDPDKSATHQLDQLGLNGKLEQVLIGFQTEFESIKSLF